MQCIIKERKNSYSTEFYDWINSIQSNFPDGVYILDLTDAVILRNDNKPYWEPYSGNKNNMQKYLPILGYSGAKNFNDIPIPNYDDIETVMTPYNTLPKSKYNWEEKLPKAVFRGNPTGCGTDSQTNMRIRLAEMMKDNYNYLDVGLIKTTNNMPRFDPVKGLKLINVNANPVDRIDMEEQSKYKYIIHIDGNVAAYRLLKTMLLGSVILKVEGKYLLWVEQLLQDGVNYIKIKEDLSDLIEKIEWCNSHSEECKVIAENGVELAKKILNKDYIDDSFLKILLNVKNAISKSSQQSPDFLPPQMYQPRSPDLPPRSPQYPDVSPAYIPDFTEYTSDTSPYIPGSPASKSSSKEIIINPNILDVEEENKESEPEAESENSESASPAESGDRKIILKDSSSSSSDVTTSTGIKKITI